MIEVIEALIIILLLIGYGIMCCVLGYKVRQMEDGDSIRKQMEECNG